MLDRYPRLRFIYKGLAIVQKLRVRYDSLKVILLGIKTAIIKVSGLIVYMDDNIIIWSDPCFYDMLCLT